MRELIFYAFEPGKFNLRVPVRKNLTAGMVGIDSGFSGVEVSLANGPLAQPFVKITPNANVKSNRAWVNWTARPLRKFFLACVVH